jgi:O-antigen ligase
VLAASLGWRPEVSWPKLHRLVLFLLLFAIPDPRLQPGGRPLSLPIRMALALVAGATVRSLYDAVHIPLSLLRVPAGEDTAFWLFSQGDMRTPQFYMGSLCFLVAGFRSEIAERHPRWRWAILALNALGLVLHFKRGVWIAFAGAVGVMALAGRRWRPLAVLALGALAALALPQVRERLARSREDAFRPGGRVDLWMEAAPFYLRKCPIGMGPAAMKNRDIRRFVPEAEPKLNHLHSNLLQVTVETGWAGGAIWLAWMSQTLVLLLRAVRRHFVPGPRAPPSAALALGTLGLFAGLLLNGAVEYNFGTGLILMLYASIMGFAVALHRAPDAADRAAAP